MDPISDKSVEQVMSRLPPQARTALHVMSEMQNREPEDVLRDEIKNISKDASLLLTSRGSSTVLKTRHTLPAI